MIFKVQSSYKIQSTSKLYKFHTNYNRMRDEQQRRKKTRSDAQSAAFTCYLIYFTIKIIVVLLLIYYDNYLKHNPILIIPFVLLLIANTYCMMTTGNDPGYQPINTIAVEQCADLTINNAETGGEQQQNCSTSRQNDNDNGNDNGKHQKYCQLCRCPKRNRMKHCYRCGRCVRKYDHHCPWIGACVGENNHFKFWTLLLCHTLQSSLAFHIFFQSLQMVQYIKEDGTFSEEYGVFIIFSIAMLFYVMFAGCLLAFHSYLLAENITTKEMMARNRVGYLRGVKGNPFSQGCIQNIKMAISPIPGGSQWIISQNYSQRQPSWISSLWSNKYYSCC